MAKKLSQPVKKSFAKARAKGGTKVMARLRQAGLEAGGKGCPECEEGDEQTGEARRKDYAPSESAGGEANGAYRVVPVDEETGD